MKRIGKYLIFISIVSLGVTLSDSSIARTEISLVSISVAPKVDADTRIAYCISISPCYAASGASVYGVGSTKENTILMTGVGLPFGYSSYTAERQGKILIIAGKALNENEIYETEYWQPFLNPWVIDTARIRFRNSGTYKRSDVSANEALLVIGEINEEDRRIHLALSC